MTTDATRRLDALEARYRVLTGELADTRAQDNIWSFAAMNSCVASIERGEPVTVSEPIGCKP